MNSRLKNTSVLFRLTLVALCSATLVSVAFAQGGTITIQGQPGIFPTIQSAISVAQPGQTVLVDGGDHPENLFITKSLQLSGINGAAINPEFGTPIRVVNPPGLVQIIGFTIKTPGIQIGVNFDGLETDPNSTATILNCRFVGGGNVIFGKEANFRIASNQFHEFAFNAIQVSGNVGNTSRLFRILSNIINGRLVVNGEVFAPTSGMVLTNANLSVDGNQINNVGNGVSATQCAGKVVNNLLVDAAAAVDLTSSPNMLVERNKSNISPAFSAAVNTLSVNTFSLRIIASSGATARNNTIDGGNSGIIVTQQSVGVTIDSNIVSNTISGFQAGGNGIILTVSSAAEIHNNNIENNVLFGLQVIGSTANATNNWWGEANGPSGAGSGSGDAISSGVPFIPFLSAPNPAAGA